MSEILQVADQYYVLATSLLAGHESTVLKQGETFAVMDPYGDVQPVTHSESGIYHRGTRHLSRLEFKVLGEQRPLLLNSTLRDDNGLLKVDMTTRDQQLKTVDGSTHFLHKGTVYIKREKFLLNASCQESIQIENYGAAEFEMEIAYRLAADFADIFEVRGISRARRGVIHPLKRDGENVILSYDGLDGVKRFTRFTLSVKDFTLEDDHVRFKLIIPAEGRVEFSTLITFSQDLLKTDDLEYEAGLTGSQLDHEAGRQKYCRVRTSNEQFDNWLRRSTDDLVVMSTETDEGYLYPYAGIPWFCAPFGRDGIITALQCLWVNPSLAKGVLNYLARTQALERIAEQDSTPGKILHERRHGEMAYLKEIPFGRYYGSIDSTPLFVCLGGQYLTRTGDRETIEQLWPSFERAIQWIDRYGDPDGDGFVEYQRENPHGLIHQGWKDSTDCVFHSDRSDASAPIALCEVQGYAYMAKVEGAKLAEVVGHRDLAESLRKSAAELKEKFDQAFWLEDLGTYALALDGNKKPCRVKSSNAGQCLFTGIVKKERAQRLVKTLMSPESFSGWGIRTIAKDEARYNPMSYHNGSVWPHDVSLIAWGMAKYGFMDQVETLFSGLFRAATYMELLRMPEVFCGFTRRTGEAPTLYPHACAPQAWASGSVYIMIQSLLGLSVDSTAKRVCFSYPRLPESIETLRIDGLVVGDSKMDVIVQNLHGDVGIQLLHRDSDISVIVER